MCFSRLMNGYVDGIQSVPLMLLITSPLLGKVIHQLAQREFWETRFSVSPLSALM